MCGDVRTPGGESMYSELSVEGSESVALTVREELARRRLSRQWLADEAKVSLSTIEKALGGSRPLTPATVGRAPGCFGARPPGGPATAVTPPAMVAPGTHGGFWPAARHMAR